MNLRISVLIILLFLSPWIAEAQVDEIRKHFLDANSKFVLVAAHRAAHQQFPENSIQAIEEAIRLGVDIVELDVKVTKDGVPVLMHDGTIDRTTTGSGKPSDFTLAELKKFRLIHNGEKTDEVIPTFDEALKVIKGKIMVDIDLKTDQLDPIIEDIQRNACMDQVFFFDNDYQALDYVRKQDTAFFIMPRAYSFHMADSAITRFNPEVVHIDFSFYSPHVVDLIKDNQARIWINALGESDVSLGTEKEGDAMNKLLRYGANIIQTDKPELLLKALDERNLRQ